MQFNLEDFINKVPVLGPVYSLLTSEAVVMSILGIAVTWFVGTEADQPLVASLIGAAVLLFLRPRVERDTRMAELREIAKANQGAYTAIVERLLGKVRYTFTIGGKQRVLDIPDEYEDDIAKLFVDMGISLIPGESSPTNEQLIRASMR